MTKKFKITSLFSSTLERLPAPNTRPIINQLEATLSELILRVNESMDELRRLWNKRLKKILEQKNEVHRFTEDKACQTNPASGKSGHSTAINNSIAPFQEASEAPERSSLLISNFNERKSIRKASIKSATCAANLIAQFEQTRFSENKPPVVWGSRLDPTADERRDFEHRRATEVSRSVDRPSLPRSLRPPSVMIEMPRGRQAILEPTPTFEHLEHSPLYPPSAGQFQPKRSSNFSLVLDDTAVNQSQEVHESRKEKDRSMVRGSTRGGDFEDWLSKDETQTMLARELHQFKQSSENKWQFNPYLNMLYQDESNQMAKYFELKRLSLEVKFLKDSMLAAHVVSEVEQLVHGLRAHKKLLVEARRAVKGLLRLWQQTFTENRKALDFLYYLSKVADPTLLVKSVNEEASKLKKVFGEFGVLFEAYKRRELLKRAAIDSCARLGPLGNLKAFAMLTVGESDSIVEVDGQIQALVEGLEQAEAHAPYYRGCDIRELIEFDLWEADRLKKARHRAQPAKPLFLSSRLGPLNYEQA